MQYVYFCDKCKGLEAYNDEKGDFVCTNCHSSLRSLHISADEWNDLSSEEMVSIIERSKSKQVLRNPFENMAPISNDIHYSADIVEDSQKKPLKTKSSRSKRKGRFNLFDTPLLPLICLGLCVWDWFSDPPVLTIILSIFIIGLSIFSIVKKCRVWGLSIIAMIFATFCIILTLIGTALGLTDEKKEEKTDTDKKTYTVSNSTNRSDDSAKRESPLQIMSLGGLNFRFSSKFELEEEQTSDDGNFYFYIDRENEKLLLMVEKDALFYTKGNSIGADQIEEVYDALMTINSNISFDGHSVVEQPSNYKEKKGMSGDVIYYLRDYEGLYEGKIVAVRSITYLNKESENTYSFGSILYVARKIMSDSTFDLLISSSGLDIRGDDSIVTDNYENNVTRGGVDPDLKAFLDSYERFMDEYVEFMKKYSQNPENALTMIGDYYDIIEKYEEFARKADQYNQDEMSKEDLAYYLDAMNRIEKKYLEILQ